MSRPLRIEFANAVYHITSRGNARENIFNGDRDRHIFLSILEEAVEMYSWICYAYCLMNNHYHLLIETPKPNLSRGMRQLNGVYAQRFNYRNGSVGHVFQSRFKAILVDKDRYLFELCRYIVLNPVRAGMVFSPEEWKWSSYRATLGMEKRPKFLNTDWILSLFSEDIEKARERYINFVLDGVVEESPWKDLKGRIFLGSKNFVNKQKQRFNSKEITKEISKAERFAGRPELSVIFDKIKTKTFRNERILQAYNIHGYSLKEIGDHLDIHYSTVSKVIKKTKEEKKSKNSKIKT